MKKYLLEKRIFIIILLPFYIAILFLTTIRQDYSILLPGDITPVVDKVFVENSYEQTGTINSVYVFSLPRTTLVMNRFASLLVGTDINQMGDSYSLLTPEEIKTRGKISYDTGMQYSIIHAYDSAGMSLDYALDGVLVSYIYKDVLVGDLQIGDRITAVNGVETVNISDFFDALEDLESATFTTDRGDVFLERQDVEGVSKFGFVIKYNYEFQSSSPAFEITETSTMGSSGGLLQTLSLFNQLTEIDFTYGLTIAGTGTITKEGYVGVIGGIEQKIIAANREKVDIFFVPSGNFESAFTTWDKINSNMKLVKVDTFLDAINYLKEYGDENA